MNKFIYGSYPTFQDAELAVEDLIKRGVAAADIVIAKNNEFVTENSSATGVEVVSTNIIEDNDSWWDDFLDLFRAETREEIDTRYNEYRDVVANGDVLVLVDKAYLAEDGTGYHAAGYVEGYDHEAHLNDGLEENHTIKLHEEQLNVRKEKESTGEVQIRKHVVRENKTIEVPVEREEIHITRTAATGQGADPNAFEEETIVVPVSEEKVIVDKDTVVTGEVNVDKTVEVEQKQVNADLRKEVVDVDDQDAIVKDDRELI